MANNNKIPLALWVSLVGIALFMVFTFLGGFLKSGDYAMNILYAVGKTALIAGMLAFLVYAKGKENNISSWKKVEIGTLVAFVIVALLFSLPLLRFFSVNAEKSQLQDCAKLDIEKIENVIKTFQEESSNRETTTATGMNNVFTSGVSRSAEVDSYLKEAGVSNISAIAIWQTERNEQDSIVCEPWYDTLNTCSDIITNWRLFEIPASSTMLQRIATQMPSELQQHSNDNNLPIIELESGKYIITDSSHVTVNSISELQFPSRLTKFPSISVLNVIFVILVNILILFRYIMANRSRKVEIGRKNNHEADGGHIL